MIEPRIRVTTPTVDQILRSSDTGSGGSNKPGPNISSIFIFSNFFVSCSDDDENDDTLLLNMSIYIATCVLIFIFTYIYIL